MPTSRSALGFCPSRQFLKKLSSSTSTGLRCSSCTITPLLVSHRLANFTSLSQKPSLPVIARSLVNRGIGPLAPPLATMVAPATNAFFFSSALAPAAAAFGGSRYHHAMAGCTSSPTVISIVPSVPMMISPISGRDPLKYGRKELVLMEEYVIFWPPGYL